jgi:hypothetical protein
MYSYNNVLVNEYIVSFALLQCIPEAANLIKRKVYLAHTFGG